MALTARQISIAAAFLTVLLIMVSHLPAALAQAPPPPELRLTIFAHTVAGKFQFTLNDITVGSTPTRLNITVINKDQPGVGHTFTIDNPARTHLISLVLNNASDQRQTSFLLNDTTKIQVGNAPAVAAQTRTDAKGLGIRFFCIPHESAGMQGIIRVGGAAPAPVGYQGFQLWAFWIGGIAMVATLGFMGVTYFIIKASSRHNTDEREHIRRGLP